MLHLENFFEKSFALLLTTPKNEKIKKKQLTRRMKGAIIAKSLVRQSISTKKTKKV